MPVHCRTARRRCGGEGSPTQASSDMRTRRPPAEPPAGERSYVPVRSHRGDCGRVLEHRRAAHAAAGGGEPDTH
ncbi:hypothetical protein NDU88_002517 [Pleurodeles waltl]|uniref:Uncharacterized protein n=1 Tax=Pleurodeles waltl TaxID=8319 RepID=A0AAV7UXF8_PLEWA|nr:hypothetical protein NDU88_002517 [Pleurodeles waltl]